LFNPVDIQLYIESGMLELYALGTLPTEQVAEVEHNLALYAELRAELAQIELTLEQYAKAHALTPKAALREQILANATSASHLATNQEGMPKGKVVPFRTAENQPRPATNNMLLWLMAASFALLLVSSFLAYSYYGKWQDASKQLVAMRTEQSRLASINRTASQRIGMLDDMMRMLHDSKTRMAKLMGTPRKTNDEVMLVWNPTSHHVLAAIMKLPVASPDKDFQLWALDGGKPVDAGILKTGPGMEFQLQQLKDVAGAQAFAITLEKKGGSPTPTLSEMYVMGEVSN